MKPEYFRSNGKLLITGEYLVIKGALALAIPVRFGQGLEITESDFQPGLIHWQTLVQSKLWMESVFDINSFEIVSSNRPENSKFILQLLKAGHQLGSKVFNVSKSYHLTSQVEFPLDWGLGSSSSLISNLAWWMKIDVFALFRSVSNGSGYDLACARSDSPILYRVGNDQPTIEHVRFDPVFKDKIYFVYLGKKQNTEKNISQMLPALDHKENEIRLTSELTMAILKSETIGKFNRIITEHEEIISKILNQPSVKNEYFPDFEGEMKSLGAWGGDFMMVTWNKTRLELEQYFAKKYLFTLFSWNEMVLHNFIK